MKNFFLSIIFCFSFLAIGTSQVSFGGGLTYFQDVGMQGRVLVEMEKFNIIPKISYYFVEGRSAMSIDVDAAYNIARINDDNPLYVFAGPSWYRTSGNGISNANIAINIGAGAQFSNIYGEIKYSQFFCDGCDGEIGFAAGYMF